MALKSFIDVPASSDFPLENLPYGVIRTRGDEARVAVALGEYAVDLAVLEEKKLLSTPERVFNQPTLNAFAALGRKTWHSVRRELQDLLMADCARLRDDAELREQVFVPLKKVEMQLPFAIGGYTDFYASEDHATNVGKLFRPNDPPLLPNWKHIPIAYNGRASTVVVDGTPVKRPEGQVKPPTATTPSFQPSAKLDYEVELGLFVGQSSSLGTPIAMNEVEDYIFGFVLVNDWSARDIQAWEYVPLGPFLGKSFATTISPWVIPAEVLTGCQVEMPAQDPTPLPYLSGKQYAYDIQIDALLKTRKLKEAVPVTRTNAKNLYWSFAQQLVHHASNGCQMRVGDLLASGTISGSSNSSWGSLLELTFNGKTPLQLPSGETRTFLEEGDELTLRGSAMVDGVRIGFGQASGKIV